MPENPKIIDAETLAKKLGPERTAEFLAYAKELKSRGKSVDEIAAGLRERFHELDDWLGGIVMFFLGR